MLMLVKSSIENESSKSRFVCGLLVFFRRSLHTANDLLEAHLELLEKEFPGLSVKVKPLLADPDPTPAAALHNVQSSCQFAFKELQASEAFVASSESATAQLAQDFRDKIDEPNVWSQSRPVWSIFGIKREQVKPFRSPTPHPSPHINLNVTFSGHSNK